MQQSMLEEYARLGINAVRSTHVDFIIGTDDLRITGITQDGREVTVFENGRFAG